MRCAFILGGRGTDKGRGDRAKEKHEGGEKEQAIAMWHAPPPHPSHPFGHHQSMFGPTEGWNVQW